MTSFITKKHKPYRQWFFFAGLYLGSLAVMGLFMGLLHLLLHVLMQGTIH